MAYAYPTYCAYCGALLLAGATVAHVEACPKGALTLHHLAIYFYAQGRLTDGP